MTEFERFSGFDVPKDFDLGSNFQYGAPELKTTLRSIYNCEDDNIVTTTGASEANFLVFSSLLGNGDEFIIEQPGYQPMWLTPKMLGARKVTWSRSFENKFSVDVESLQNLLTKKTKLVVLTNLHNPTGVLTNQTSLKKIAKIADESSAYVLVDEIFLDGSFTSQPSSFGIPNVIVTSSATKIYGLGGLHSGWIVGPKKVVAQCQTLKAHCTGASCYISEIMTAHILQHARDELIKRFHKRSKTNFELIKKWMDHHKEWFTWVRPDGGIICFPRYSMNISSIRLCHYLLKAQKILVNPGAYFNQEGFVRISYGCRTRQLQDALDALEKALLSLSPHL
jgi:aspartate/methionine/tyrosine aminotransferase